VQNYCWGLNSGGAHKTRNEGRKEGEEDEDEEDEFVDLRVAKGGLHSSFDILLFSYESIGHTLNNFTTHITNIIIDDGKIYNFQNF
jgi:hypothetical protein